VTNHVDAKLTERDSNCGFLQSVPQSHPRYAVDTVKSLLNTGGKQGPCDVFSSLSTQSCALKYSSSLNDELEVSACRFNLVRL